MASRKEGLDSSWMVRAVRCEVQPHRTTWLWAWGPLLAHASAPRLIAASGPRCRRCSVQGTGGYGQGHCSSDPWARSRSRCPRLVGSGAIVTLGRASNTRHEKRPLSLSSSLLETLDSRRTKRGPRLPVLITFFRAWPTRDCLPRGEPELLTGEALTPHSPHSPFAPSPSKQVCRPSAWTSLLSISCPRTPSPCPLLPGPPGLGQNLGGNTRSGLNTSSCHSPMGAQAGAVLPPWASLTCWCPRHPRCTQGQMGGARVCVCLVAPRAALMQWDPQPPPCSGLVGETLPLQDGSGQGVRVFTITGWACASGLQISGTSFAWQGMAIPGPRCRLGRLGHGADCCCGPHSVCAQDRKSTRLNSSH